ncbi:MAG TPA: arylsulfotransferase family protein [Thermoanaerobaculia bacterium]|nr:arylsulfotransferase family protein [Thermoanaerobaculia bacterium]
MTPAASFSTCLSLPPALILLLAAALASSCGARPADSPEPERGTELAAAKIAVDPEAEPAAVTPGDDLAGKWRQARPFEAARPSDERSLPNLRALPYLQGYRPAEEHPVVVRLDPAAEQAGLNLYLSGHAAEAVLMDMDGHALHTWRYPLRRLWPDLAKDPAMAKLEYWRRVYLFPNGDLLGIYEGQGLVKLDARSRVLWSHRGGIHHDLEVTADGDIWVLDRDGKLIPRLNPKEGVLEDMITVLGSDGKVRRRISVLRAFEHSRFRGLLARRPPAGDIFHTNTLELLDGRFAARNPALRKGNVLISVLKLDTIAILDPDREEVVWAETGSFKRQHQPTFLPDGHLLLFDNTGLGGERSRVLEIDPFGSRPGRVIWQYGGLPGEALFSKTLGSCQRLTEGNTLITESENGRALEVTPEGRIVWEFRNPHRAGARGELVAVLFEMLRLPLDFPFPQGRGTIDTTSLRGISRSTVSAHGGL